MAAVSRIVSDC